MVVAAIGHPVINHRSEKAAANSPVYVPSSQWRVLTWWLAAALLLVLEGCSGVLKAADEQTPAILNEGPAVEEPELNAPSVAISIPEDVQELPKEKELEIPDTIAMPALPKVETGLASWYGAKHHGKRTASGERFDQKKLTAAHPTLPWGSIVKVTSVVNGRSVNVRINDRGPFIKGRIIDLSRAAARALEMTGLMQVQLEVLTSTETLDNPQFSQEERHQATAQAPNQN